MQNISFLPHSALFNEPSLDYKSKKNRVAIYYHQKKSFSMHFIVAKIKTCFYTKIFMQELEFWLESPNQDTSPNLLIEVRIYIYIKSALIFILWHIIWIQIFAPKFLCRNSNFDSKFYSKIRIKILLQIYWSR